MRLVIASHNLMDGRRLDGLVHHHVRALRQDGLDVLCIQENRRPDGSACAPVIARALGPSFAAVGDHPRTRLAIVYNRRRLELCRHDVFELPRLAKLTRFERLFTAPQQKYLQLAVFAEQAGSRFTVANFHLDTAGGNGHRTDQIEAVSRLVRARDLGARVVACGDTNAFSVRRSAQLASLARVLAPLADLGARDPGHQPTHFFARQREPKFTHQVAVALGRLGIDVPGRYDVVCTNLEATRRGQRSTPESDHDFVWAELAIAS